MVWLDTSVLLHRVTPTEQLTSELAGAGVGVEVAVFMGFGSDFSSLSLHFIP